ncbi:aminotransferase class I/II-fold pyridoxal phosphate-dependent enzyme [Psychroserpens sp. MEBiC05023]
MLPKKLQNKLDKRQQENAFRQLGEAKGLVDFSSNDYLGFSSNKAIFNQVHEYLINHNILKNGATGSRLLSGNHKLYLLVEQLISTFHNAESTLIFNSGYTANLGFFSCVPQRNDIILYDEYCHASIRDGIAMSNAKSYKFNHNNIIDLGQKCQTERSRSLKDTEIYIVTESVFSMDGDSPDLKALVQLCQNHKARLIIDQAHGIGVCGKNGAGLINELQLEDAIFARIITFGKALGTHGAAILCDKALRDYLINFSRPFIFTTALPPHTLATIKMIYNELTIQSSINDSALSKLQQNITWFKAEIERLNLQNLFIKSDSAIQSCIVSGNDNVKQIANSIQQHGFDVKAILSPTIPKGKERLRFCLHSYNSSEEISKVLKLLATFV